MSNQVNPYIYGPSYWYNGLFGGSDVGNVIDFNDLSTLWQDTAHTVPVTTVGDPIQCVQCKRTLAYLPKSSGACTLAFDAVNNLYYAAVGTGTSATQCLFLGTGIVPSGLGGDSTAGLSLVAVGSFTTGVQGQPIYIGPSTIGTANAATLGNDSSFLLDFAQGGAGFGAAASGANGTLVLAGSKSVRSGGNVTYRVYSSGTQQASSTNAVAANITTLDLRIGRHANSGDKIYSCVAINREFTAAENTSIAAAAL